MTPEVPAAGAAEELLVPVAPTAGAAGGAGGTPGEVVAVGATAGAGGTPGLGDPEGGGGTMLTSDTKETDRARVFLGWV